VQARKLIIGDD
jgi:hypothetical protein